MISSDNLRHCNWFFCSAPVSQGNDLYVHSSKMADKFGYIFGAISDPLLTKYISRYVFSYIPKHFRSKLNFSSVSTETDRRYIAFFYDKLTNISVNHSDIWVVLSRGLTASDKTSRPAMQG